MIDLVTKSIFSAISAFFVDYFKLKTLYSPNMDPEREFQRDYDIGEENDSRLVENLDSKSVLLYKRSPLTFSEIAHTVTDKLWVDSGSRKNQAQFKDFILGKYNLDCKFVSNLSEASDIFELFYVSKFQKNSNIDVSMLFEDALEPVSFIYDIECQDISNLDYVDYIKLGSIKALDFSMTIRGVFLTPESSYYPKLLNTSINYLVVGRDNKIRNINDLDLTQVSTNLVDEKGRILDLNSVRLEKDSALIISRFNLIN